jgi:hypothetical protein
MSTGHVEGKLVAREFWPACANCRAFAACKLRPLHPAYPHTWHWGKEVASFPDGELILRSWVGTAAIGQPHTGCPRYIVDSRCLKELSPHHQQYLALEAERAQIEATFARLEQQEDWNPREEDTFARLLARYKQIMAQQAALRSPVLHTDPGATAVTV